MTAGGVKKMLEEKGFLTVDKEIDKEKMQEVITSILDYLNSKKQKNLATSTADTIGIHLVETVGSDERVG